MSIGKDSYLLLADSGSPDGADGLDLVSENLQDLVDMFEEDGIIGGREPDQAYAIAMAQRPGGSFVYRPRYGQLDRLFGLVLGGGSAAATWYPLATASLSEFTMELCKAGAAYYSIGGCAMSAVVLQSESNGLFTAEPSILAADCFTETEPTTPTYANLTGPFIKHSDLVITGTTGISGLKVFRYQLTIDNDMEDDGHANSTQRQTKEIGLFTSSLELDVNYSAALAANWDTWYRAKTLLNVIATYSSGGNTLVLDFQGKLTSPAPNISEGGRQRHTMTFEGKTTKSGGAVTKHAIEAAVTTAA